MPNCAYRRRKLLQSHLLKCAETKLSGQTKRKLPRKFRNTSLNLIEFQHVSGIIIMIIKRNSTSLIIESSYYWNPPYERYKRNVLIKSLWWVVVSGRWCVFIQCNGLVCNIVCHAGENNISITIKQQQKSWFIKTLQLNDEVRLTGLSWYLDLEELSLSFWPQLSID